MCQISKEKLISCQLSFYPLGQEGYMESIENVLEIIKKNEVEYRTNDMSTIIIGPQEDIFRLLNRITDMMYDEQFVLNSTISNTCGI